MRREGGLKGWSLSWKNEVLDGGYERNLFGYKT